MNNKEIQSVEYKNLQPGDIVFLRPPLDQSLPFSRRIIGYVQALINQKDGHFDSDHVGILVSNKNKDALEICHITTEGFHREAFDPNNNPNHALAIVMRADNAQVQTNIAKSISDEHTKNANAFNWSMAAAVKSLYHSIRKSTPKEVENEKIKLNTICSKLVIQSIKKATVNHPDYQPTIHSNSLPKMLEGNLYQNANYKVMSFTGPHNAYDYVKNVIQQQINRLLESKNPNAVAKGQLLKGKYEQITRELAWQKGSVETAIRLLRDLGPMLSMNTGHNLRQSASYTAAMSAARKFGIYERDIVGKNNKIENGVVTPHIPTKK